MILLKLPGLMDFTRFSAEEELNCGLTSALKLPAYASKKANYLFSEGNLTASRVHLAPKSNACSGFFTHEKWIVEFPVCWNSLWLFQSPRRSMRRPWKLLCKSGLVWREELELVACSTVRTVWEPDLVKQAFSFLGRWFTSALKTILPVSIFLSG